MLVYAYFAKRQRRREQEFAAQHDVNTNGETPQLVISDHTEPDSPAEKPTSPTSTSGLTSSPNGVETPGATLSPTRTGPQPGLTPLDSHASSTTGYEQHQHHHHHHEENPNVERRARHKYTIRRPRALQYTYRRKLHLAGDEAHNLHPANSSEHFEKSDISSHLPEAVAKQRERLDLFIDLIWVGIISNLSEVFSTLNFNPQYSTPGTATLVFCLVFLPSWRIWNGMREFLNNYYMDDLLQRFFQFWILVCSVFYGNQLAYLAEDIDGVKKWIITTYLIITGSFLLIEEVYSIFIPWLRRLILWSALIRMPSVGLWIAAIMLPGTKAIAPIVCAIIWEYCCPLIMDSPWAETLTPSEYRKALDVNHFQARMGNFFIIVLGEGVLQLVKDGPLGKGINGNLGVMSWVLLIYFGISFLYFVKDGSKTFVPAVRHKGWRFLTFVFWHIPLFSSLLTFVASVMFIIRHEYQANYNQAQDEEGLTHSEVISYTYDAVWTCATSLAIIMLSMIILALLDQPLDKPGTLRVDNRWIRLSGRMIYIIIIMMLPLYHDLDSELFLGLASGLFVALTMWEWNASLEKGGGFIEPRGLSLMMSHELKGKRQVAVAPGDEHEHNHPHRRWHFEGPLARVSL